MPIIEYQLNYDYITTILCENVDRPYLECNGKCYLIDRMSDTSKLSQEQNSIPTINIDDCPISLIQDVSVHFMTSERIVKHHFNQGWELNNRYATAKLRPPIYC